ncbi:MAG: outer rane efflux protein [Hyphomicrobiales bacterium]|nr:outer rane efflux protein [Hyphomicrobiales bacterium]
MCKKVILNEKRLGNLLYVLAFSPLICALPGVGTEAAAQTADESPIRRTAVHAALRLSSYNLPMFAGGGTTLSGETGDALTGVVGFMITKASPPYSTQGRADFIRAVRAAVATHPAIGSAIADVAAQEAGSREAYAGFLPTITGSGDAGYRSYGVNASTAAGVQKSRAPSVGLTLRQLVFDFGATSSAYDASLARQTQSQADLAAARGDYTMRAIAAYVDVMRMRSHNTLAEQNVSARQSLLDQVRERSRSGGGSDSEVTRAEGRHTEAQANAASVANRLSAAESQFAEIFGREPPALMPMPVDPPIKNADRPLPELLLAYAPAQSRQSARDAADRDADALKYRALPRVNLELSHSRREWDGLSIGRSGSDTTAVLALRYDFYSGGADKARAEAAAFKAGRAALEYELVRRQFERALAQARADVTSTASIQDARIRAAKAAVKSMEAVNEQFQFNRGSLLDAIKTQEELYAAGKDMVDAVADRFLARYRLLYYTSQLDELFQLENVDVTALKETAAPARAAPKPKKPAAGK